MNYIAEIRAFYGWLGANPLKSPAIALWHALMSIANEASSDANWQMQITPAISTLQSRCGLSKDAIITARNQLKQAGRIDWRSRGGSGSAVYTIIPFVSEIPTQTPPQLPPQLPPIYKLNQTKPNHEKESEKEKGADAPAPTYRKHGQYGWVRLTDEEHRRLIKEFGEETTAHYIAYVDESAEQTGNKNRWKNWNLTVRKAIRDKWGFYAAPKQQTAAKAEPAGRGSSYNIDELERMVMEGKL